jgi:hypothetical protein
MKALVILVTLLSALAASAVGAEVTNTVVVRLEVAPPPATNATNELPTPPSTPSPLSLKMRQAAQEARGKAAPWAQRFIAVKVEVLQLNQTEDDDDGVPRGKTSFTTNYLVTLAPVAGTEPLAVWGAVKAKTIRVVTQRPTAKGDEFTFYPEL